MALAIYPDEPYIANTLVSVVESIGRACGRRQ